MQLLPPQSDSEVQPVVEGLQRLDHLLDVLWEPKAHLTKRSTFDVYGCVSGAPEYEGRWQVIRYDTDRIHLERPYAVICEVTEVDESTPAKLMKWKGPYAPIGQWVVDYMARFDAAQARFAEEMEKVWKEHEEAESLEHLINDHAAHQEAAHKVYREHGGGEYWMGRGFGEGPRRARQAPAPLIITP